MASIPPSIALAPAIIASDLVETPEDPQINAYLRFETGLFVGNVWFTGGYEIMAEANHQIRSVGVDLQDIEVGEKQAREATNQAFAQALTELGANWTRVPTTVAAAVPPPTRDKYRGSHPDDGSDNVNLPRFEWTPLPLNKDALPALPGQPTAILVPIIVANYTHNAGWFAGQAKGCPAGARFHVLWSLHETSTGDIIAWGDANTRHLVPREYTPNRAQLDDYQLAVEASLQSLVVNQLTPTSGD